MQWILVLVFLALSGVVRAEERLGTVVFSTSCKPALSAQFDRGVALLHDFWYDEAQRQFAAIAAADPTCAMAHWGIAMSQFHQIWNRPNAQTMKDGAAQMRLAQAPRAKTARERDYIDALSRFYAPGKATFETRVSSYSGAMRALSRRYPDDVDAAAFFALSVLAAEPTGDTSLTAEREAQHVLQPWFGRTPEHPGVVHYLIHACDTPSLAPDGLAAARHYGEIASSGSHAAHMPGHIFARLGLWQEDIDANEAAVQASEAAQVEHPGEGFDEFHADEFLLYAYLQSGQATQAAQVIERNAALLTKFEAMPGAGHGHMSHLYGFYRVEFPAIYALELRDWQKAAGISVDDGADGTVRLLALWTRSIAHGHLRDAVAAHADLERYNAALATLKRGSDAYIADTTFVQVMSAESAGWTAFADGDVAQAELSLRQAADLQDKVGQNEVDIPAREMLADLLLEAQRPAAALVEYRAALRLSPNRFNGLYDAGLAAEAAGDPASAQSFYKNLLAVTDDGRHSTRPELAHVKGFVKANPVAMSSR